MKWFHNEQMAVVWAILVELVVHGIMAFGAFLLGGFLGEIVLGSIIGQDIGVQIGAWFLALFVFCAAFQAFVLGEYMKEHVRSFEQTSRGDGSYIRNWKLVRWLVGGIELASLAFRCFDAYSQGHLAQAIIIGVFGVLALWYAYAQAKVIHASVNRPLAYDVYQARRKMTQDLVKDALDYSDDMTTEEKARFLGGDPSGIDEARARKQGELQEQARAKERKQRERRHVEELREEREREDADEYGQAQSFLSKLLSPFGGAQTNQPSSDRLSEFSQNGRRQ